MTYIDVTNQTQLDKALKNAKPTDIILIKGNGYFELSGSASVRASGSASVRAYDSASVTAYDSASVTASGSASVRASGSASVTASGSASVTASGSASVTAYDSASVRAYDSASVRAYDSASVRASKFVAVQSHPTTFGSPKVVGGVLITIPEIKTVAEWLDFHGVEVKRGIAVLFKAVDDDYSTDYARRAGIAYAPGNKPAAPDWNGRPECGGGLHLSPRPVMALTYNPTATRYVACPVKVADVVLIDDKVKAPRIARPVYEVDVDGDRLAAA